MTRRWSAAAGLMLLLAGLGVELVAAPPAAADSCVAMTVAQGQGLSFDVSSVLVTTGGCVRFANLTDVTVTVKVSGSSFSERLPAKTPASASGAYVASSSATVTATDGIRTGRGTITVEAASPTPTVVSTYIPPPVESIAPVPPTQPASPPPTPKASPAAHHSHSAHSSHSPAVASLPILPSLPPGSSTAPPAADHPVVAPQVRESAVAAQPAAPVVEPVSGAGRGLPAIIAAVAVIGLGAAFGRAVLAAVPAVDRRGRHARLPL